LLTTNLSRTSSHPAGEFTTDLLTLNGPTSIVGRGVRLMETPELGPSTIIALAPIGRAADNMAVLVDGAHTQSLCFSFL